MKNRIRNELLCVVIGGFIGFFICYIWVGYHLKNINPIVGGWHSVEDNTSFDVYEDVIYFYQNDKDIANSIYEEYEYEIDNQKHTITVHFPEGDQVFGFNKQSHLILSDDQVVIKEYCFCG